jgi:hypothetical protein
LWQGISIQIAGVKGKPLVPQNQAVLDAMFQERRVAAIVRSPYQIDHGTQVISLCRRNLAIDIKWPIFRDWNNTQSSGVVKEQMV